jgi:ion channel
MLTKLLAAWVLMSACVVIHAGGVSVALRRMPQHFAAYTAFWRWTWLFVRIAGWIILLHLFEIAAWGIFYVSTGAMSDVQSAMYFSAVTYTTTGYGDLVLPAEWRLVGGVEALTGILMCGWSTGFFFAVVTRLFESRGA